MRSILHFIRVFVGYLEHPDFKPCGQQTTRGNPPPNEIPAPRTRPDWTNLNTWKGEREERMVERNKKKKKDE